MANQYLKTAAANLHRAANSLHQQVLEMQGNLTRIRAEKHRIIDSNANEVKAVRIEHAATSDAGQQSRLSVKISKLQQEIMDAEKELKQAEADITTAVNAKIDQATGIESQAKQLDNQAATID